MDSKDLMPWNWFGKRNFHIKKNNIFAKDFDQYINRVLEDFPKDFNSFLPRLFKGCRFANFKTLPQLDFSETDDEYIIEVELPGVKEEDLVLLVSKDSTLTLKGKREIKKEKNERNYYKMERSYGSFERSFVLPVDCDFDKIDASFKDGLLTLQMPKKELAAGEVKKIKINKK